MIQPGYMFLGDLNAPQDVSGYEVILTRWNELIREPQWFGELLAGGVQVYLHWAACYFPGDPAATQGGLPYRVVGHYANEHGAWLRNPDGAIAVDGQGSHYLDMRCSREHSRALAHVGLLAFLEELERRTTIVPTGVFLDCVWDRGPWRTTWRGTEAERDDWERGMTRYLTTVAFNLRRKRRDPLSIYINGDSGQTKLFDGVCYEGWPVNGDYMAIMADRGPAWSREHDLDPPMVIPQQACGSAKAWAVASAVGMLEAFAGDAIVFDNDGTVFELADRLAQEEW